jgi:hypothetical protein
MPRDYCFKIVKNNVSFVYNSSIYCENFRNFPEEIKLQILIGDIIDEIQVKPEKIGKNLTESEEAYE